MRRNIAPIVFLAIVPLINPSGAAAQAPADRWTYSLTPYLWLPSMEGNLRYGPPPLGGASANVSIDADTLLGGLNMVFMGAAEARKGRWSITTDLMYIDIGSDSSKISSIDFNPGGGPINIATASIDLGTETQVKATAWTLIGGYSAIYQPRATMDIVGGFRYLNMKATTDWQLSATVVGPAGSQNFAQSGSVSKSQDFLDAIVGVRGQFKVGDGNWFVPYHFDVGAGDSKLTWQAIVGVGYAYKWGDLLFSYRYLTYETGSDKLMKDLTLSGVGMGVKFRF